MCCNWVGLGFVEDAEKVLDLVGRRMSVLRKKAKLTQAQVAETAGIALTNYQRIEYGGQNLTLRTMVRIANAIGCQLVDFLVDEEG